MKNNGFSRFHKVAWKIWVSISSTPPSYVQAYAVVQVSLDPGDWSPDDMDEIATAFFKQCDIDALNPHPKFDYECR